MKLNELKNTIEDYTKGLTDDEYNKFLVMIEEVKSKHEHKRWIQKFHERLKLNSFYGGFKLFD